VAAVTDRIGLSSRRFIELFRRQVGLTPKVFCRVRRFQHVLRTIHREKDIEWAQIALECGYYDQPHFIHDFQSFSGLTPERLSRRRYASSQSRSLDPLSSSPHNGHAVRAQLR
jgi:AraC-like DNA-binding protein